MTEQEHVSIARDMGEMKADMRTVKHDVQNMKMGMETIYSQVRDLHVSTSSIDDIKKDIQSIFTKVNSLNAQQSKSLGFFAGASAIIGLFSAGFIYIAQLVFGGHH